MNSDQIVALRLSNQQLINSKFTTPQMLVSHFGAIQAQNYEMAKYAIGLRISAKEKIIDNAVNKVDIIRTHVLRPTWHFVSTKDIRWMLELTAPHVKKLNSPLCKKLELDGSILTQCYSIIEKMLEKDLQISRDEIMLELNANNICTKDTRSSLIMMNAELDGIVCNGKMNGKQHTYALFDRQIPISKPITKEKALAKLGAIYFSSHGPATLEDYCWWSGLSVTNAKLSIELIKTDFQSIKTNNQTYWFKDNLQFQKENDSSAHFLPAFDEFLISYRSRTASISIEKQAQVFTKNGLFKPTIILNGKVIGIWNRSIKKEKVIIETTFLEPVKNEQKKNILKTIEKYENYIEKTIEII